MVYLTTSSIFLHVVRELCDFRSRLHALSTDGPGTVRLFSF